MRAAPKAVAVSFFLLVLGISSPGQRSFQLRLLDQTMEKLATSPPVCLKMTFDVQPGSYQVRSILRDAEGQQLTTQNATVEIP